jgi:hypothetical protein
MGEVYRADDLLLGQAVALKFLPERLKDDPDRLKRFYAEVRIAQQISHPAVCRIHDLRHVDGQPFLSMEFIDGEDLKSLLRRIGRLPGAKALETARQLAAGLAAATLAALLGATNTLNYESDFWIALPFNLLMFALLMLVVMRYGLLATIVNVLVINLVLNLPITSRLGHWTGEPTLWVMGVVAAMAVWGFLTSLGSRSLLGDSLLDS